MRRRKPFSTHEADAAARMIRARTLMVRHYITTAALARGMTVELEHGRSLGRKTNVTGDDVLTTARIALAHLLEDPDYYEKLSLIEENPRRRRR